MFQELGFRRASSFDEITRDAFTQLALESIYGNINNVDAYVGGMAEDPVGNSTLGQLFYSSVKDQYERLRDGDRFYFENTDNGLFTAAEIEEVKRNGLRALMLRNTNMQVLPANVFLAPNSRIAWMLETADAESASSEDVVAQEIVLKVGSIRKSDNHLNVGHLLMCRTVQRL